MRDHIHDNRDALVSDGAVAHICGGDFNLDPSRESDAQTLGRLESTLDMIGAGLVIPKRHFATFDDGRGHLVLITLLDPELKRTSATFSGKSLAREASVNKTIVPSNLVVEP